MIKKPVLPRMLGLLAGYMVVFVIIVMIQFTKHGNFVEHLGNLTISGQYRITEQNQSPLGFYGQPLSGAVVLSFEGMEFRLIEEERFVSVSTNGERRNILPEYITKREQTAMFRLSDGSMLSFAVQDGEEQELSISATLAERTEKLEIPYRPLKTARIQDSGNGEFSIMFKGANYGFDRPLMDPDRRVLVFSNGSPLISYHVIQPQSAAAPVIDEPVFNPEDFIIDQAQDRTAYNNAVESWRTKVFAVWNRTIGSLNDENQIIAYESESISKGLYRQARVSVSNAFLNGGQRTFESSVYLGRMDQALRSMSSTERETQARLIQEINAKSQDFFKETHPIEFLYLRGLTGMIDTLSSWVSAIEPSTLTPDSIPGIFECYTDWAVYKPNTDNPFARFNDRAFSLISAGIRMTKQGVFVFNNGAADMAFNVRLGNSLYIYAESTGKDDWAAAGRSLILSVISLTDNAGTLPAEFLISDVIADTPDFSKAGTTINAAHIYRLLTLGDNYPHMVGASVNGQPIWMWTAATIATTVGNNTLDISATFPVGETHYMLIRGVRPVSRLQLYNIDFRTAPDFERYDSSGWSYSVSEQTLLIKMKHRSLVEHVRIWW